MKKRLIGSLLMGALLVSSTSVFVSCKDYDDDINNIVATKADKTELEKAKADLEAEIGSLKGRLSTAEGNIQTLTNDLTTLTNNYNDFLAGDFATVKGKVTTLEGNVADLQSGKADKATYAGKIFNLIDEIERAVAAENALDSRLQTAEQTLISINQTLAQKLDKEEFDDSIKSIYGQLEALSTGLGGALERIGNLEQGLKDSCLAVRAVLADYKQQLITLNNFKADFDANYKEKITDAYTKANTIYADYLKTADKNALLDSIRNRYNALNTKFDGKVTYLNDSIDKVAANLKASIAALSDSIADHTATMQGLRTDVNKNATAIQKINEELVVLNTLLNNTLRGLVFRPESYYWGIEALTIHVMNTYYFHDGTETVIPAANADLKEKKGYTDAAGLNFAQAGARTAHERYDSTQIWFVLPTHADYHMNPSSADLSKVKAVTILSDDKPYMTRSSNEGAAAGLFCNSSITAHDWTSEPGVLKINLQATDPDKVKVINTNTNNSKVTVFATQLTLRNGDKDTTVTSDYAAIVRDTIKELRLAHKHMGYVAKDNIVNTHCGQCALYAATDHKTHLMATVAEAAAIAPQDSVNWNDTLDLSTLIETHYTTTTGQHAVLSAAQMKEYGLTYKYELTYLDKGSIETAQSVQAAIKDSLLRPQNPDNDGKAQAWGVGKQDVNTVGRTPVVRVTLYKDGKALDYGYIRVIITRPRIETPLKEPTWFAYDGKAFAYTYNYECNFTKPGYEFETTWYRTQHDIYDKLMNDAQIGTISREEFELHYKTQVPTGSQVADRAIPVMYSVPGATPNDATKSAGELQQYDVTEVNGIKVFTAIPYANKVGTVSTVNDVDAENGMVTSKLKWVLTGDQAESYYVNLTDKNAKTTPAIGDYGKNGIAVKYVSDDPYNYPDFYIIFKPGTATVAFNKPAGTVKYDGKKIDNYWYNDNSHSADGTADTDEKEIHVNVFSPEDLRGINRYAAKGVEVTDTMALLISSTLVGNDAKAIVEVSNDQTANKEYQWDKLYLKFIFDASNEGKSYKGADGKTYKTHVLNDSVLQAYDPTTDVSNNGTITYAEDIAYLVHDGLAVGNAHDSINHQKIVYNKAVTQKHYAEKLLNYEGRFERTDNALKAFIGVKANNGCKTLDLTQAPFAVRFDRPINVEAGDVKTIQDAGDGGRQIINLRDLIKLTDWRNVAFRQFNGIDYWSYYNIKAIRIEGVPANTTNIAPYVTTDLNKANRTADKEWATLSEVTNDLILDYAPIAKQVPAYGDAASYGTLEYQNLSGSLGNFKLKLPIVIEYQWGLTKKTDIIVDVLSTQSARVK